MRSDKADCVNCGNVFEQRRKDHFFCCRACRYEYWAKTHPRIALGKGFKIVQDEPVRNPTATREKT